MSSEAPLGLQPGDGAGWTQEETQAGARPRLFSRRHAHVRHVGDRQVDARHRPNPQRRGHYQSQGKALGQDQRPRNPHQRNLHRHTDLGCERQERVRPRAGGERLPRHHLHVQFNRVSKKLRSRAPRIVNPRRVASPFLLSGLVKCRTCKRALTGQCSKNAQFTYYVCQTLMKQGKGSCDAPRLNARRFEELVVDQIRSSIFTEDNVPDLVKVVDEEIDGMVAEDYKRVQTIEAEIRDVKKQMDRIWRYIATRDDVDAAQTSARMAEVPGPPGASQGRGDERERGAGPVQVSFGRRRRKLRNTPDGWTTSWIVANLRNAGRSSSRSSRRSW